MVRILRNDLTLDAVLENATNIVQENTLNGIGSLSFSIPYNDPKRSFIQPFRYVECEGLYRILPAGLAKDISGGMLTITCEHVFATLLDDALPGWHQTGGEGIYTRDAIEYVLGFQTTENWVLGDCEFYDQYEYGWQHEKCLTALASIGAVLTDYKWEHDTSVYPWVLHLRKIDTTETPGFRIAYGHNRTGITKEIDPTSLVTRLFCYGYGEGINQLNIADVNGGLLYLDAPQWVKNLYGIKAGYYVAREIEDAETLKASGEAILEKAMQPKIVYTVTAVDLFEISGNDLDRPEVGKIVKVYDEEEFTTFITSVTRQIGRENQVEVRLSNIPDDIANTIAEIADRQRIEQTYAQGATQLYAQSIQANATPSEFAVLNFFAPEELRYINAVKIKVTLDRFRAYSQATGSGGQSSQTSESGGGTSTSTSTGGGSAVTSGSSSTSTTAGSGSFPAITTGVPQGWVSSPESHTHSVPTGALSHSHGMQHNHSVSVPNHSHGFSVPNYSHEFSVPAHTHPITAGIYKFGNPTSAMVKVNGVEVGSMGINAEIDITMFLTSGGKIPRGSWQRIEVVPNDLSYVTINMNFQGFVQSRGGGNF